MFELTDVEVTRGGRRILAVDRLTLADLPLTAVLGHNGSGKSTLMSLLAREQRPTRGTLRLAGRAIAEYGQRHLAQTVAYLPQRPPEGAGLTVRELCGLGRFAWTGALRRWRAEDAAAVDDALARTAMTGFAGRLVDHLSGGERQRAWIAMLLAQQAPVLLLDEPTSALDLAHQLEVLTLLRELGRADRRIVVILHDVNLAARFADRIVALKDGRIAFDGGAAALMDRATLTGLYGVGIELVEHPSHGAPVAVIA